MSVPLEDLPLDVPLENVPLLKEGCVFGGLYVHYIYLHAKWSYRRRFTDQFFVDVSLVCRALFLAFVCWFCRFTGVGLKGTREGV